jgi:hypothetical protein
MRIKQNDNSFLIGSKYNATEYYNICYSTLYRCKSRQKLIFVISHFYKQKIITLHEYKRI